MTKKQLKMASSQGGIMESREVIQELREIKSDIREVKKFLIISSLRQLVENYDKLAEKNEQRQKEIAEWDKI